MKHEQPEHFVETDIEQMLKNAREDQIKRLLQDVGFLPRDFNTGRAGGQDESS